MPWLLNPPPDNAGPQRGMSLRDATRRTGKAVLAFDGGKNRPVQRDTSGNVVHRKEFPEGTRYAFGDINGPQKHAFQSEVEWLEHGRRGDDQIEATGMEGRGQMFGGVGWLPQD